MSHMYVFPNDHQQSSRSVGIWAAGAWLQFFMLFSWTIECRIIENNWPKKPFLMHGSSDKTTKNVVYPEVLTSGGKLSNGQCVIWPHATKSRIALPKNPTGQQKIVNPKTRNTQDAITAFEDKYEKFRIEFFAETLLYVFIGEISYFPNNLSWGLCH